MDGVTALPVARELTRAQRRRSIYLHCTTELMEAKNELYSEIRRVVILGSVFPASSIIKALAHAGLDVHVIHPHLSQDLIDHAVYHEAKTSASELSPLLSEIKPDLVISTAHGGSYDTQKEIIDSAIVARVSRFIAPEFGQDSLNEQVQERLPPNRAKARVIKYLQEQAAEKRISWAAIATGVDLDRGLMNGKLGFDIKWQSATLHGQGHEHFAASSSSWIGKVVLAVIRHWQEVQNQYLYAAGTITTANGIVASFEKVTGKKFEVSRGDVGECVDEARKRIERGFPDAGMFLMARSVMYDESIRAVESFERDDGKGRLGLEEESEEDIVRRIAHEIEHHAVGSCGCD